MTPPGPGAVPVWLECFEEIALDEGQIAARPRWKDQARRKSSWRSNSVTAQSMKTRTFALR